MASENSLHRLFAGYQHKCSGRGFGERSQGSVRGAEYRLSRRLGIAWILGCCATLKTRSNFSAQCRHILSDLVVGDLGVNLGRGDMFMSQHLRYGIQRIIGAFEREGPVSREVHVLITVVNHFSNGEKFDTELCTRLLTLVDDPTIPVVVCMNICMGQFRNVRIA